MKDNYELKGKPRKNHYAEKMKIGYSVSINYESPEAVKKAINKGSIQNLLEQPGLKSIQLNIKESATKPVKEAIAL